MKKPKNIDDYITAFPAATQKALMQVRSAIKKELPRAQEVIWYAIPAFKMNKVVISFAAWKTHIGLYLGTKASKHFQKEIAKYKTLKGTVRFPLDKPMPLDLIRRIVKFNAKQEAAASLVKSSLTKTKASLDKGIQTYNNAQAPEEHEICNVLSNEISRHLPEAENKIWHAHPVWFLDGNPIVGYSKLKDSVRLLFWSGQSFDEEGLENEGSFKAAEVRYTAAKQINKGDLKRWLAKAKKIQWDYKNIVKRKGVLVRL